MKQFLARHNRAVLRSGRIMIFAGVLGFVLYLSIHALSALFLKSPAFTPLVWSPDGRHLAFGMREGYNTSGLYLADPADARIEHYVALCTPPINFCGGEIAYLTWSEDSKTVYFGAYTSASRQDYAISIDNWKLRQVKLEDVPPIPPSGSESVDRGKCGNDGSVQTQELHSSGLLAQSVCTQDCDSCKIMQCTQELEVCDTETGKRVFDFDGIDFVWTGRSSWRDTLLQGGSLALLIGGALLIITGKRQGHAR